MGSQVKIAPRHQFDAFGRAIGDVAYESVRDDHDDLFRMPHRNFSETGKRPLAKRRRAFAAGHRVIGIAALELFVRFGVPLLNFNCCEAFEKTEMTLAQPRLDDQFVSRHLGDRAGGVMRAA